MADGLRLFPLQLGRATLGVSAFLDLLDDLCAEGIEVARIARGDDAVIDHHLGILPFRAAVDDVRPYGLA